MPEPQELTVAEFSKNIREKVRSDDPKYDKLRTWANQTATKYQGLGRKITDQELAAAAMESLPGVKERVKFKDLQPVTKGGAPGITAPSIPPPTETPNTPPGEAPSTFGGIWKEFMSGGREVANRLYQGAASQGYSSGLEVTNPKAAKNIPTVEEAYPKTAAAAQFVGGAGQRVAEATDAATGKYGLGMAVALSLSPEAIAVPALAAATGWTGWTTLKELGEVAKNPTPETLGKAAADVAMLIPAVDSLAPSVRRRVSQIVGKMADGVTSSLSRLKGGREEIRAVAENTARLRDNLKAVKAKLAETPKPAEKPATPTPEKKPTPTPGPAVRPREQSATRQAQAEARSEEPRYIAQQAEGREVSPRTAPEELYELPRQAKPAVASRKGEVIETPKPDPVTPTPIQTGATYKAKTLPGVPKGSTVIFRGDSPKGTIVDIVDSSGRMNQKILPYKMGGLGRHVEITRSGPETYRPPAPETPDRIRAPRTVRGALPPHSGPVGMPEPPVAPLPGPETVSQAQSARTQPPLGLPAGQSASPDFSSEGLAKRWGIPQQNAASILTAKPETLRTNVSELTQALERAKAIKKPQARKEAVDTLTRMLQAHYEALRVKAGAPVMGARATETPPSPEIQAPAGIPSGAGAEPEQVQKGTTAEPPTPEPARSVEDRVRSIVKGDPVNADRLLTDSGSYSHAELKALSNQLGLNPGGKSKFDYASALVRHFQSQSVAAAQKSNIGPQEVSGAIENILATAKRYKAPRIKIAAKDARGNVLFENEFDMPDEDEDPSGMIRYISGPLLELPGLHQIDVTPLTDFATKAKFTKILGKTPSPPTGP